MPEDVGPDAFLADAPPPESRRRGLARAMARPRTRTALMLSVPLLIAIAGLVLWATGGRYVSTENAYVRRPLVTVSAEVEGRITEVFVVEGQTVAEGAPLFVVDPEPYEFALAEAEASHAMAVTEVDRARAAYESALAEVAAAEQDRGFRGREFERQEQLANRGVAAASQFDAVSNALSEADQRLARARQDVAAARAALGGDPEAPTTEHPLVRAAAARRERAAFDLARTQARAPYAGTIAQADRLDPGEYVNAGAPVLALVGADRVWVEAQYKESQITHLRAGQPVTVRVDAYPGEVFEGVIESIGAATDAEFSLLPAQNATGNWVKVTQWAPARIAIETPDAAERLRAGLSARVRVDTGARRGLFGRHRSRSEPN